MIGSLVAIPGHWSRIFGGSSNWRSLVELLPLLYSRHNTPSCSHALSSIMESENKEGEQVAIIVSCSSSLYVFVWHLCWTGDTKCIGQMKWSDVTYSSRIIQTEYSLCSFLNKSTSLHQEELMWLQNYIWDKCLCLVLAAAVVCGEHTWKWWPLTQALRENFTKGLGTKLLKVSA